MDYSYEEALIAMGYRLLGSGVWVKQLGFVLLAYVAEKGWWKVMFIDMQNLPAIYTAKELWRDDPNFLLKLKQNESELFAVGLCQSEFEFITAEEYLKCHLG